MSCKLSVNLNKIALIRNARGRDYPSVEAFASKALTAGAHGVTIHPRPDQRHARYSDIAALRDVTRRYPGTELNVEGYPDDTFLAQVIAARPDQCTLVPDAPGQLTSDHGWDLTRHLDTVRDVVARLSAAGIRTSIFMDPDPAQIALAPATGADRIELYTEAYAHAPDALSLAPYAAAARQAGELGLGVNAGHDLNLDNLGAFVAAVPQVAEVSIGHALTVEALEFGFDETIRRYVAILSPR
ncbi:MAG: pyridoxine 5'-phosphate synthase [Paludibacterium sp.]|uniref:pyridoxine 5'-phosphate synthase n=1 Tax=Paludibacterium sp. TaxID=1917523 RepID=UPI0025FA559E|nr:pyridoxine 5'-phosphate synthase [Paludibacterium sp.]MBV8049423.1 pyridoxine 5'-phosphate synthase [Paludibacterium sp.]MBV8645788.1 pyridoxine 5'-phosphate synthase [Paludibacterium sp.]